LGDRTDFTTGFLSRNSY